jgi:hypothetical protein
MGTFMESKKIIISTVNILKMEISFSEILPLLFLNIIPIKIR